MYGATGRSRLRPGTWAFTAFLGLLAALPTFGIDMVLPSLTGTASALGAPVGESGLAMSAYLLGLGAALPVFGPLSDRVGRRPAIAIGCAVLVAGSLGCMTATSFPSFLACRALQGAGAAGPGMAALAIGRDVSAGGQARAMMSFVVGVINVVPMLAPSLGAGLLRLGGWRLIHAAPVAAASALMIALRHFDETTTVATRDGARSARILRDYARVLAEPVFLGNALCNAAAAAAVFAYIAGSSLVFIDALGMDPVRYGLIFGASSLSVMCGAALNGHLAARGVPAARAVALGLALATGCAALLLAAVAGGVRSPFPLVAAMVGVAVAFGLVSPNTVEAATRSHPGIAGAAGAMAIFLQMVGAAAGSGLVARFFDGRSALSTASVMLAACLAADASYAALARPAELRAGAAHSRPTPAGAEGDSP